MKIERFQEGARAGLRLWSVAVLGDDLALDAISSLPENWSWVWFLLRESEDRPEWFPRGKWATIQHLESQLIAEAKEHIGAIEAEQCADREKVQP